MDDTVSTGLVPAHQLTPNRGRRQSTEAVIYTAKPILDADVIIEDEENVGGNVKSKKKKPTKKSVLVSRSTADILAKRPASATPGSHGENDIKVTRRSVSRQGSRIQQGSRMEILEDEEYTTNNVLKSQLQDDEKVARLRDMIGYSRKVLRCHAEKTKNYCTERKSRAFHAAMQIIQTRRTLLLTGKTGSGKTHTALDLLNGLLETYPNFYPVIARSPYELNILETSSRELVILFDDCFGFKGSNSSHVGGWRRIEKLSRGLLERKQAYFILTTDNTMYDCAMDVENGPGIPFIRGITRVDLESDAFRLTMKEQVSLLPLICKNQQHILCMKDTLFDTSEFDNPYIGFPLICNFLATADTKLLVQDPFRCLSGFILETRERKIASYILLLHILLMDDGFPVAGLPNTDKTLFLKLLETFNQPKCTYADIIESIESLVELNLVIKDVSKANYIFPHRLVYLAVLQDITHCKFDDVLDMLPISAVNDIQFKVPELDEYVHNSPYTADIKVTINLTKPHCHIIASKFKSALESKKPGIFEEIASSHLWNNKMFIEVVKNTIGYQLFFKEDESKVPLSAYLVRCGQTDLLCEVYTVVTQTHGSLSLSIQEQLAQTIEESIRETNKPVFTRYSKLYLGNDHAIVRAALDIGNIEIFKIVLNPAGPFRNSLTAILPLACAYESLDIVEYILTQLDKDAVSTLLHKRDQDGRTLLHFAAKGGSVDIFDFLLSQGLDIRTQIKLDMTVLDIAAIHGRTHLVRHITSRAKYMVELTDHHGFTVAHYATREGHLDVLKHVISEGADATLKVQGGNTIFHLATYNGHVSTLDFLIDTYPNLLPLQNDEYFMPIHLAAKAGQIEVVDFLLKRGTDPNVRTVDNRSLLHIAAFNGKQDLVEHLCSKYPEIVKFVDNDGNTIAHDASASGNLDTLIYLIDNHIDPYAYSSDGCTLLHEACYYGRTNVMKYLVANYQKLLTVRSRNGYSCCHAAALGGIPEILDYLIRHGADPGALSEDGSTILHEATFSGKLEMVKYITAHCKEMLEIGNVKSYMPIHFAAQEGHMEVFMHLLSVTEGDIPDTNENQTVLHVAAYNGRLNIVKYLCSKITELLCKKDMNGAVATHYAARGGFNEILEYLLTKGMDPSAVTSTGSNLVHLAAFDGRLETTKYLCTKFPALINTLDDSGHHAGHYGAGSGNLDLLIYLIEQGLDPIALTSNGSTLLLKAAYGGGLDVVKYLCLNYPEMLLTADEFGCGALHYAACGGHVDVLKYLCTEGLDPMIKTKDGHTLLHVAAYHGQITMVTFLCQEYPDLRNVTDGLGQTPDQFAQLGEQLEVLRYFKKDKRKSGMAQVAERLPTCAEGCTEWVGSLLGRCVGLVCCCRRNR